MLHLHPNLVLMERAVDDQAPRRTVYDLIPPPQALIAPSGTLWKATRATRDKGRLIWDEMIDDVVSEVDEAFALR